MIATLASVADLFVKMLESVGTHQNLGNTTFKNVHLIEGPTCLALP